MRKYVRFRVGVYKALGKLPGMQGVRFQDIAVYETTKTIQRQEGPTDVAMVEIVLMMPGTLSVRADHTKFEMEMLSRAPNSPAWGLVMEGTAGDLFERYNAEIARVG